MITLEYRHEQNHGQQRELGHLPEVWRARLDRSEHGQNAGVRNMRFQSSPGVAMGVVLVIAGIAAIGGLIYLCIRILL